MPENILELEDITTTRPRPVEPELSFAIEERNIPLPQTQPILYIKKTSKGVFINNKLV